MGGPSSKEFSYAYEGKTYYFCCSQCIEEFKKDPQKYISKIKEIKLEVYQYGFSPDPLVVKKDDIVMMEITSRDVTHGMYIKEYGINLSVKKGEVKKIEFLADKTGKFDIICSVYCGPGHSEMKGALIVEEK
jgi:cytochrome c oxidase subunit 2